MFTIIIKKIADLMVSLVLITCIMKTYINNISNSFIRQTFVNPVTGGRRPPPKNCIKTGDLETRTEEELDLPLCKPKDGKIKPTK